MPEKEIKLIALDVDGTIMDKNFNISGQVKTAINKAIDKGIYVLIATGRMYSATVPIAKFLGLKTPLIVYQGSLIQEFYRSEKILIHYTVPTDISLQVIRDLRQYGVQINAYLDDNLYAENISPILDEYASKRNTSVFKVDNFENIDKFNPTKILGLDYDTDLIDKMKKELKEKYKGLINITKSTPNFCEFVNNKCSKASSILFLAEKWGIDQSQIMAIGDQENDKEMLEIAEIGVAMKNGDAELKKMADYVTDSVDNNGVAHAIEKFVLN